MHRIRCPDERLVWFQWGMRSNVARYGTVLQSKMPTSVERVRVFFYRFVSKRTVRASCSFYPFHVVCRTPLKLEVSEFRMAGSFTQECIELDFGDRFFGLEDATCEFPAVRAAPETAPYAPFRRSVRIRDVQPKRVVVSIRFDAPAPTFEYDGRHVRRVVHVCMAER